MKVNFLSLKLIKAKAALPMFLVSLMLLCRGVSLGPFAVPVPILSLFTESCVVRIEGALLTHTAYGLFVFLHGAFWGGRGLYPFSSVTFPCFHAL